MSRYCYVNGMIVPEKEARISIFDIGLQRGYAVFDVARIRPYIANLEEGFNGADVVTGSGPHQFQ